METSKKKFLKNLAGFSMCTWISFILGFIATPISTRLFPTSQLGRLNMFNTYASLFSSVCYLGLDQAYVRLFNEPPEGSSKKGLLTLCLGTSLGFAVLSSLVLLIGWRGISVEIVGYDDIMTFLCLCVYSVCLVIFRFLSLNFRMEQNALQYTLQGVLHVLLTKIAYLGIGLIRPTGKAALSSLTLLMTLFTAAYVILQRRRFDFGSMPRGRSIRPVASYALPLVPLNVLSWLNSSMSGVVLKHLMNYSALGIYTSALGLSSTVNIIQTGFNTYWAPYVLENYRSDDRGRFYTVHRLMACMLTLFGLGIALLQVPVFLLLGRDYRGSAAFFPFLFMSPICYCLGETTDMGITISKKSYWTTLVYLFSSTVNIVLCFVLIPLLNMTGAALATALSAVLTLILRTAVGEHYYSILKSSRYVAATILFMLSAGFANYLLTGAVKYAMLGGITLAACVFYRRELKVILTTAAEILRDLLGKHKK